MADTNLSQTISATNDSGSVYDTNVKKLLADKQILSWILKYTVDEFKDMDILNIRSCIGNEIEEIGLKSRMVFGTTSNRHDTDLMKGIVVNIRNGGGADKGDIKKSKNKLIAMLEELFSEKGVDEKKQILTNEYGMIMIEELEGRMQDMCNLSELVEEKGIEKGISLERINAIERMIKADFSTEQIISCGYTKEEIERAENVMYANV